MDSSTSFQENQPYSPLNRVTFDMNFEQLMYNHDYYAGQGSGHDNHDNYPSQDYSMDRGSVYGSSPVDDDSLVKDMSPVKARKPSKRASKAKTNDNKEPPKDWTMAKEIVLCKVGAMCQKIASKEMLKRLRGFGMRSKLV
uniref:Uncharacterized protein n=1 Tax=Tanacetum cinerariifolium TaxID=118510 RepID=A0A699IMD6_TANCI|nr:hypothetical protein [Tanacetum cinerariifolium]